MVHGLFNAGPAGNLGPVRHVVPGMSQTDISSSTAPSGPAAPRIDLREVAISGGATLAWYAVPDVVRSRRARALVKTAVLVSGFALAMATRGGSEARAAARDVRDAVGAFGAVDPADPADPGGPACPTGAGDADGTGRPVLTGAVVVGGLAVAGTVAVLGERWAYRAGEHLRARGVRAPHTTVGLVLGAATAGLAVVEGRLSAGLSRSTAE